MAKKTTPAPAAATADSSSAAAAAKGFASYCEIIRESNRQTCAEGCRRFNGKTCCETRRQTGPQSAGRCQSFGRRRYAQSPAKPRRPAPLTLVKNDVWLAPYEPVLRARQARLQARLAEIEQYHGSLLNYATAHQQLGLNHDAARGGWVYREWAPAATGLFLIGDFNGWDRRANPLQKLEFGVWEVFLPDAEYDHRLTHGSRYKVNVVTEAGGKGPPARHPAPRRAGRAHQGLRRPNLAPCPALRLD